jgi:predicted nucleic acid-binding protein
MSAPLLVADSGPLIALARLDLLALPARYFDSVLVTASVWEEVTRSPKGSETERLALALEGGHMALVDDPLEVAEAILQAGLDVGERNSIAYGLGMGTTVLIDEKRGRRVAEALGVPVIGTLGLLLRGREEGVLPSLRASVEALQASGYFLSADLVDRVLAEFGE